MKKLMLVLFLAASASGANAGGWPWGTYSMEEPVDYCKGLVLGGLSSNQVAGVSRTDLWLAWSYLVRSGPLSHNEATSAEFQTGRDLFSSTVDAATQQQHMDDADGTCGLGRSGHQIAGW